MERRTFVTSMLSAAMLGRVSGSGAAQEAGTKPVAPEFYLWRQYILRAGPQPRRLAEYLEQALVPALNRLGHKPVGVFEVLAGIPSPTLFTLTPLSSLDGVGTLEARLHKDEVFAKAASPYFDAVAADPVYLRMETAVLAAFANVPRVEVPAATAAKAPRIFELRTYESHSERAHRMKVRMFAEMGEVDIFRRVGLTPVFFASTLAGARMPSLVYMLAHESMSAREKSWDSFRNDAEWKKLRSTPGYADAEIVSNITTVLLRPAGYSQI